MFWGSGEETRDWIHVEDATEIIYALATRPDPPPVVNGATGDRVTVSEVLEKLRGALDKDVPIEFNGMSRTGDPRFYHADVRKLRMLGVVPTIDLGDGLRSYATWFKSVWSG